MTPLDVSQITSWHAHVHFDAGSRDAARAFRDVVTARFGDTIVARSKLRAGSSGRRWLKARRY